jgi:hypothetical protein
MKTLLAKQIDNNGPRFTSGFFFGLAKKIIETGVVQQVHGDCHSRSHGNSHGDRRGAFDL